MAVTITITIRAVAVDRLVEAIEAVGVDPAAVAADVIRYLPDRYFRVDAATN